MIYKKKPLNPKWKKDEGLMINKPVHEDIGVVPERFPAKETGVQEMRKRDRIVETGRSGTEGSGEERVR